MFYVVVEIKGADERLYLECSANDTIGEIKAKIGEKKGAAPELQFLFCLGVPLEDMEVTIGAYGITASEGECSETRMMVKIISEGVIPLAETQFLDDLWFSCNGPRWKRTDGWDNRKDAPHDALGIRVDDGHIVGIVLPDNNLKGGIPPSIANCTQLHDLQLPYNHFKGSIPDELWACTRLRRVCLQYNQLTGGISPAIGRVTRLVQLYLDHNKLSGALPEDAFGRCVELERLNLANNHFSGRVPIDFGRLIKLQVLRLQHNDFITSKAMNLNMSAQDIVTWARWERVKKFDAELDALDD